MTKADSVRQAVQQAQYETARWNRHLEGDRQAQQIVKEIDSGLKRLNEHIDQRQEKTR
jgi:hypothetical protein